MRLMKMLTFAMLQWNRFDVYCSRRLVDCLLMDVMKSANRQTATAGLPMINRVESRRSRILPLIYCLTASLPAGDDRISSSLGTVVEEIPDLAGFKLSGMMNALHDPRMAIPSPSINGSHGSSAIRYALTGVARTSDRITALVRRNKAVALRTNQ